MLKGVDRSYPMGFQSVQASAGRLAIRMPLLLSLFQLKGNEVPGRLSLLLNSILPCFLLNLTG